MSETELIVWLHERAGEHFRQLKAMREIGIWSASAELQELEVLLAVVYQRGFGDGAYSMGVRQASEDQGKK